MRLYHFTTKLDGEKIIHDGLNRGAIIFPQRPIIQPVIWLTQDSRFNAQHWATNNLGVCGDRTEIRLAVELPNDNKLFRWNLYAKHNLNINSESLRFFNEGGGSDGEAWWIYLGILSKKCVIEMIAKPCLIGIGR